MPEKGKTLTAVVIIIAVIAFFCCIGFGLVIVIPNFVQFGARAKEAECRQYLKRLYVEQKALFAEKELYATDFETLEFKPEDKTRYAYVIAPGQVLEPILEASQRPGLFEAMPAAVRQSLGLQGTCPDCDVTMACVGDIDGDPGVDVWTISTKERRLGGETIPAGELRHDVDDLDD